MKKWLFMILLIILCISIWMVVGNKTPSFSVSYSLTLPEHITLVTDDASGFDTLVWEDNIIGGVACCPYPDPDWEPLFSTGNYLADRSEQIFQTLEKAEIPCAEPCTYDHMFGSSSIADCDFWLGKPGQEYQGSFVFYDQGILVLWFDLNQIESGEASSIASTLVFES